MATNTDLDLAIKQLTAKGSRYSQLWNYYDGAQPLIYNNEKLREIFHGLNARFTVNWCAVVIDSILDRMNIIGASVPKDKPATSRLADLWQSSGINQDIDTVHEELTVTGESFVIAWVNPVSEEIEAYHNDARLIHVEYDAENPRTQRFAAKWWKGEDERYMLNLYYPDRLETYRADQKTQAVAGSAPLADGKGFTLQDEQQNPFNTIPVFHFRSNGRRPISQIINVIEPQDAINKLMADMMVSAEFGAYSQRYIISSATIGKMKNSPNIIWDLPAGGEGEQPTSVGQFDATDLGNYLAAIDKLAMAIGVITRTPKHYFYGQGGDPSGEALIALEAPLNKKTQRLINTVTPTWQALSSFLLALDNQQVDPRLIFVNYDKPQTVQPRTQAEIRKLNREAGLPLNSILRDEGWDVADLAELEEDLRVESAANANFAEAALGAAERNFDGGNA